MKKNNKKKEIKFNNISVYLNYYIRLVDKKIRENFNIGLHDSFEDLSIFCSDNTNKRNFK